MFPHRRAFCAAYHPAALHAAAQLASLSTTLPGPRAWRALTLQLEPDPLRQRQL